MELIALSSGSSGNCFYIEHKNLAILIDVGISAKQVEARLAQRNKSLEKIKAIFITHEHTDHIRGADVLARKLNIPIFATNKTFSSHFICSDESLLKKINKNKKLKFNSLSIEPFSKSHSAAEPVSYKIHAEKTLSIITDLGHVCPNTKRAIHDSDFLCLESNHDLNLLQTGPYPLFLKKWILSNEGHLSNNQAALAVLEHASSKLKTIVLSHLSKTNNTPEIALRTSRQILKERSDFQNINLFVSHHNEPTQVFQI
jgi:phosphoribosyl 1,2-cyclic phosphodiesterase